MKIRLGLFLTAVFSFHALGQNQMTEATFKRNCLGYIRQTYGVCKNGEFVRLKDFSTQRIRIEQNVSEACYLASAQGNTRVFAVIIPGKSYADGEELYGRLSESPTLFSYQTVMGSKATVKQYEFEDLPRPVTSDEIVEAFNRGQSFWVSMPIFITCDRCCGRGTEPIKSGTFVVQSLCRNCNGKKKIPDVELVSVSKSK